MAAPSPERSARAFPQSAPLFFAATWLLLAVAGRKQMFNDPGTFWHLLTGERILTEGLPHEDWLTFTFQGKPWIAHQWLSECAMALLHRVGGFDALLVAVSGMLALLFAWLFGRMVERGVQLRWAVLLTTLGLMTGVGSFNVRPAVLSIALFTFVLARLEAVEAGRARLASLGWSLPVLVLWVNCHGAVLGAIASMWLVGGWWLVLWGTGGASPVRGRPDACLLALLLAGAALTPLVNPYGLAMVRTWLAIVRSPVIAETIIEHGSVWRTGTWYVLVLPFMYVLLYCSARAERWKGINLLPLVWLVLTLERVRHAPLFAIAALVALPGLLRASRLVTWLARHGIEVCGAARTPVAAPRLAWLAPVAALGLTFGLHHAGVSAGAGPDPERWPFSLREQIAAAAHAGGAGTPILNDMALGGFLAYEVPGVRIFGDDRCELYGDAFLRAWYQGRPAFFAEWIARTDIRVALAEIGTPLYVYLRSAPGWHQVTRSTSAILFQRDRSSVAAP